MQFEELLLSVIQKLSAGQRMDANELEELRVTARRLQQAEQTLNSIVQPGNFLHIGGFRIAGGDVIGDDKGMFIKNDREAAFSIGDVENNRQKIFFVVDENNYLHFVNRSTSTDPLGGIALEAFLAESTTLGRNLNIAEDTIQDNRVRLWLEDGSQGCRFLMGLDGLFDVRTEGSGGGSTFVRMRETTSTPPEPGDGDAFHLYIKGDKFIIQFNDGGTVRYKYLDLTGTGTTWTHTTSAP